MRRQERELSRGDLGVGPGDRFGASRGGSGLFERGMRRAENQHSLTGLASHNERIIRPHPGSFFRGVEPGEGSQVTRASAICRRNPWAPGLTVRARADERVERQGAGIGIIMCCLDREQHFLTETRYIVPPGANWAVWEDVNGVLSFMTDAEAVENARENERELGAEFAKSSLPEDPTPQQAWAYVNALWEGDPGGRGWQVRIPAGATWLSLRDDDEASRGPGPVPTFAFGEPPLGKGVWQTAGY